MVGTRWLVLLAVVAAAECHEYMQRNFYTYRRAVAPRARPARPKVSRDEYSSSSRKDFDTVDDLIAPEIHIRIHGNLINLWGDSEDDRIAQRTKAEVGEMNARAAQHVAALSVRRKRAVKKERKQFNIAGVPSKHDIEKPLKQQEDKREEDEDDESSASSKEDLKRDGVDSSEEEADEEEPDEEEPETKEVLKKKDEEKKHKDDKRGRGRNERKVFGDYVRREENVDVNSIYYLAALNQKEKEKLAKQMAEEFFERNFQLVADVKEAERMKSNEKLKEVILAIAEKLKDEPSADVADDSLMELKNAIHKAGDFDDN